MRLGDQRETSAGDGQRDEQGSVEQRLRAAFSRGELLDLRTGKEDEDDPTHGETWGSERTVPAELIAELLLSEAAPEPGRVPGLQLAGACITGTLNVVDGEVAYRLDLRGCHLEKAPQLAEASLRTVSITDSVLPGLDAGAAEVQGGLYLNGCRAGKISMISAHITGQLGLSGAQLANEGGYALNAAQLTVEDSMFCRDGFTAAGEVRLLGAHIGGQLSLGDAQLTNDGGHALHANWLTIEQSMFCGEGFTAAGEVRLLGAHIGGQLSLGGAQLTNPDGWALNCQTMQAESIWLRDGFTATGEVNLVNARVGTVCDDPECWPEQLNMDGLVYDDLQPYLPPRRRLGWLNRSADDYAPQPFEQLATYYRRLGHESEARKVLVAKHRHRRAILGWPRRLGNVVLQAVVGYGYRPGRALGWMLAVLAAGSWFFAANPPAPLRPDEHPHYQPVIYTADLLLPVISLGQDRAWNPDGLAQWVATALILLGWLLATAIVAGVTRVLTRY